MNTRRMNRNTNIIISLTTVLAVMGGILFYDGFSALDWPMLLVLLIIQMYLVRSRISVTERTSVSLRSSVIIPMVYLIGITPSIFVSVFLAVYEGIKYKTLWYRVVFNAAQFALCVLVAALSFGYFAQLLGESYWSLIFAAAISTLLYFLTNIALVSCVSCIWESKSWWVQFRGIFGVSLYSIWCTGLIGVIFMFFVDSYGFWGLLAFSLLLVNLMELLSVATQVSLEREQRRTLEKKLIIDEMTGAYNFRYMNEWLSNPSDQHISILFMDIDDFAVFNDKHGHAEGDRVLKLLVETIRQSTRSGDQVVRYGGDEFVVFLRGLDEVGAQKVAERIVENLRQLTDPKWEQPITVSLGISSIPTHTFDKRQLLLFADQAMYQAKESGKNSIKMWSPIESSA